MEARVAFTKAMKRDHTILIPNMLPVHFKLIEKLLKAHGYHVALLQNEGRAVIDAGLKYVHNDTCYPALLCIGQFLDALNSGLYDVDKTALLITQTGGGCRASNYIHLLRKALFKAGYAQVPVISLNPRGFEQNSGFQLSLPLIIRAMLLVAYGDMLLMLKNQVLPYEINKGDTQRLMDEWTQKLTAMVQLPRFLTPRKFRRTLRDMAASFADVACRDEAKPRVGIVGEIYVKYAAMANNHLEAFLLMQGCEPVVPGLMNFLLYALNSPLEDRRLYGGNALGAKASLIGKKLLIRIEKAIHHALASEKRFTAPMPFEQMHALAKGMIGHGCKMGEGWLLTAEMMELIQSGCDNIICVQPFGCLPNHIVGKGMMRAVREKYPKANIVAIDYDPGATRVNQENRIRLMLASAKKAK